jgi:hypothetical protein
MDSAPLIPLLYVWILILGVIVFAVLKRPSCGLTMSYCFQMWMLYWLGALIHVFPWSELPETEYAVLGFQQATWGMAAFLLGLLIASKPLGKAILGKDILEPSGDGSDIEMDMAKARKYVNMGLISYFFIAPTIGRLRGFNALPAATSQMVVSGCCLQAWMVWHKSGKAGLLRVLPQTILIPMVTLIRQGFLSYGVMALSTIMLFIAQFFRPRWLLALAFLVSAYPGLTVYVSYMRDRNDIRAVVWSGQDSSLKDRLATGWHTLSTLDAFDPFNPEHLEYIDGRLNQNGLVGTAVANLADQGGYLHGSTIKDALLAMIPRLIWPSKPMSAGSGNLAARLTGLEFASGTSVGVGPVLEFYGNFGTVGVVLGFFFFGSLIGALDYCAGVGLRLGNWSMFTSFFLVGISCLNVSGSLVEITAGAVAAAVVAYAIRRMERKQQRQFQPAPAMP